MTDINRLKSLMEKATPYEILARFRNDGSMEHDLFAAINALPHLLAPAFVA